MNTNEIIDTMRNKGFAVEASRNGGAFISLNRSISKMEVEIALDFQIEQEQFVRVNSETIFVPGW